MNFDDDKLFTEKSELFSEQQFVTGEVTPQDKLIFAKQLLLWSLMLILVFLIASFLPIHHNNQFIRLIQQIFPVVTLIIGSFFNK
jgi:hypothetical protein